MTKNLYIERRSHDALCLTAGIWQFPNILSNDKATKNAHLDVYKLAHPHCRQPLLASFCNVLPYIHTSVGFGVVSFLTEWAMPEPQPWERAMRLLPRFFVYKYNHHIHPPRQGAAWHKTKKYENLMWY